MFRYVPVAIPDSNGHRPSFSFYAHARNAHACCVRVVLCLLSQYKLASVLLYPWTPVPFSARPAERSSCREPFGPNPSYHYSSALREIGRRLPAIALRETTISAVEPFGHYPSYYHSSAFRPQTASYSSLCDYNINICRAFCTSEQHSSKRRQL